MLRAPFLRSYGTFNREVLKKSKPVRIIETSTNIFLRKNLKDRTNESLPGIFACLQRKSKQHHNLMLSSFCDELLIQHNMSYIGIIKYAGPSKENISKRAGPHLWALPKKDGPRRNFVVIQ